ncbi:two-component system chemotaxis response regulator CheB [Sporomusaceae bacterium BoRhaA]|uniref:protein-glutamate methylesterase/protein-glutamine glutaminase n=1 Tax=Pelorhabdus rhamnosifermentans TaxID=2772457 RepID=UPI001C060462|nr:chemotaxis response regulator protein-glutamate methylesterase [Pelorhabdus rhamnosifermentans]MBU2701991.1 two-component system chemotaxis response regulator CheB [Pelorhabdus rhamnosifermentans]
MIRVLIVDDSAFMRKLLTDQFVGQSDFTVIDTARNGKDAIDKVKRLKPDLVTMDVEMPSMDGLEALEKIMQDTPVPVVMISSLTHAGAESTIRALQLGAVDFITKTVGPVSSISGIQSEMLDKCRAAVKANVVQLKKRLISSQQESKVLLSSRTNAIDEKIVAIGTSTGGPRALQEVLTRLPGSLSSGIVIVQHMPPGFTRSLAERLNSLSALTVKEAENNDVVRHGLVLIAPGNFHMTLERQQNKTIVKLNQNPPIGGLRPAVDPMMESVANLYKQKAVGVILTGMGRDGSIGISAIKKYNGITIAEDQSTAVVYGMPKAAVELGVIDHVVPLQAIADQIVKSVTK